MPSAPLGIILNTFCAVKDITDILLLEPLRRYLMKYQVVLNRNEEGYSVHCPGLPGCWSEGETEEEALDNIAEAIADYRIAVREESKSADVREVEVAV